MDGFGQPESEPWKPKRNQKKIKFNIFNEGVNPIKIDLFNDAFKIIKDGWIEMEKERKGRQAFSKIFQSTRKGYGHRHLKTTDISKVKLVMAQSYCCYNSASDKTLNRTSHRLHDNRASRLYVYMPESMVIPTYCKSSLVNVFEIHFSNFEKCMSQINNNAIVTLCVHPDIKFV
ncbi:hypothetical protein U3516DRAFT_752457 [Neocallimastix sp. 'constans']